MAFRPGERVRPQLALNAIRVLTPPGSIPASVVPFDRALLHAYLDRPENDVFATRHDGTDMAVVPLTAGANLPTDRMELPAAEHLRLVSALTREAVFRLLAASPEAGLLIRRRPPPGAGKRPHVRAAAVSCFPNGGNGVGVLGINPEFRTEFFCQREFLFSQVDGNNLTATRGL